MILPVTNPKTAGRSDDKQGGDTVIEAIACNVELVDKSTWLWANLWLTSEQMGFPLRLSGGGEHEERAEN